ncbi:rho GTPase-activating protein 45-like isoform X3 [Tachypleus tridentatus]|uniref:rho GTPase-activating protein 45-like isoform X3 n=1 Tax=Tachypleus tridentatus TaxID=6853 RepID=UPI003FD4D592
MRTVIPFNLTDITSDVKENTLPRMKALPIFKTHIRSRSAVNIPSLSDTSTQLSSSMNDISSEEPPQSPLVEKEDLTTLTYHVRRLKEPLGRLKRIFHPDRDKQETTRAVASERLGEVLQIIRVILEKYPFLKSTELFMSVSTIIKHVREYDYENEKSDPSTFLDIIEQFSQVFCNRVSDYIMGDADPQLAHKEESSENLLTSDNDATLIFSSDNGPASPVLSPEDIDLKLLAIEDGVSHAFQRAKLWSKYAKDVISYVEKKTSLQMEYARNLSKLAQSMKPVLKEECFLPFQSIYCTALDQDIENASSIYDNCELLRNHKFIEPLSARRYEYEKARKQIKEKWHRELKKMEEAVTNLRKARALYVQRQQDYEKAKDSAAKAEICENNESSNKVDKKRRIEDDTLQKAKESETIYKACVAEANERQQFLEKIKKEVLQEIRELICLCDQTMKAVTVSYFQLQHTISAPCPVQYQTLCESSRLYEPGRQYMEYVKRLPQLSERYTKTQPAFVFEPYSSDSKSEKSRPSNVSSDSYEDLLHHHPVEPKHSCDSRISESGSLPQPIRFWSGVTRFLQGSDTDSTSSCHSTKSQENSTPPSPLLLPYKFRSMSLGEELEMVSSHIDSALPCGKRPFMSKAAETHSFKKIRRPSKCRECDSYVYFQGIECFQCGLACHKKCLENLAIQCGGTRMSCRMTTFGIDLTTHAAETGRKIPSIVVRCIYEIDQRGSCIKGIYRVSGVKSRVENLCQCFENRPDLVDLSKIHPFVIANVLKRYFMQLPEPLLTFKLYQDFIDLSKDYSAQKEVGNKEVIEKLKKLVNQLPSVHYVTLAFLMHHLKRISENVEESNMPPSNLGIVFGPNLLKTSEGNASLNSLLDTVYQARAIELLITYVDEIFGPPEVAYPSILPELEEMLRKERIYEGDKYALQRTVSATSEVSDYDESQIDSFNDSVENDGTEDSELIDESVLQASPELELPVTRNELYNCDSDDWLASEIELDDETPETLFFAENISPFYRSTCSFYRKSRSRKANRKNLNDIVNAQSIENNDHVKSNEQHPSHENVSVHCSQTVSESPLSGSKESLGLDSAPQPPPRKHSPLFWSSSPKTCKAERPVNQIPFETCEDINKHEASSVPDINNTSSSASDTSVAEQNVLTAVLKSQQQDIVPDSQMLETFSDSSSCLKSLSSSQLQLSKMKNNCQQTDLIPNQHTELTNQKGSEQEQGKDEFLDGQLQTSSFTDSSFRNREILGLSVLDKKINLPGSRYSLASLPVHMSKNISRTWSLSKEGAQNILARQLNSVDSQLTNQNSMACDETPQQEMDDSMRKYERKHFTNVTYIADNSSQAPAVSLLSSSLNLLSPKLRSSKIFMTDKKGDLQETERASSPSDQLHFV